MHWSRIPEAGSRWGLSFILGAYRILGYRFAGWFLYPVTAYFWLANPAARKASLNYLQRLYRHTPDAFDTKPGLPDSFRHMLAFAYSGLDKLAAWAGDLASQEVDFPEQDSFRDLTQSRRGALLIGAHLGNLEMTRALARELPDVVINAVVYTDHAQRFNDMLASVDPDFHVNLIQVSSLGPETAILLREKIERGEWLVIVGDRTPPSENGRTVQAEFLGQPAPFAQGPWILAHLLDCPVYLFFCLRLHNGRYRIVFEPFSEHVALPRNDREAGMMQLAQRYARRLEALCAMAPLQWFNFYDFWQTSSHKNNDPV